ncbi:MAG: sigma 54-dependent Fis family transcriptional regulator [Proteobacteria bacterium]|nr:sigma 54-dependent Fis family transcriptional regulator [Pseudomonadota bacterium]
MYRIILYHQGIPVIHHSLDKSCFSIGVHPTNDLVLADSGVADRRLVIYRGSNGCWRARPIENEMSHNETDLDPGTRVALGPFSVEIEPIKSDEEKKPGRCSLPSASDEFPNFGLAGVSTQMRLLRMEIARLGPLEAPVLVDGETGTGKELIAGGLHSCSRRRDGQFVVVNCGGMTSSLMEDTLFGHERGAFTGAFAARKGVFEQASSGTLFLDEIGELPLVQQAALLRVLDDKIVRPIGSERSEMVDFRLIAATNRNLLDLTKRGRFRLDLYHRIAALKISSAPLKDRIEDVEPTAAHFLVQMASEIGERRLSTGAVEKLSTYPWPGNARELRNALYRAAALSGNKLLRARDFDIDTPRRKPKRRSFRLDKVADARLEELLDQNRGNVTEVARILGVPRTSLRDRLKRTHEEYDLDESEQPIPMSLVL